jgi:YD repeat-containing protein
MVLRILFFSLILCVSGALFADAVTYTYDDAGRLVSASYPNGAAIAYTYDAAGNLTARTVTAAADSSADSARRRSAELKGKAKAGGARKAPRVKPKAKP